MIHLILLAAGCSRRFGSNKLLFELDGRPLYRHTLERVIEAAKMLTATGAFDTTAYADADTAADTDAVMQFDSIHLYVVSQYEEILQDVTALAATASTDHFCIRAVSSPDSAKGISYSIRAGLTAAGDDGLYFFFVADQPHLTADTICRFIRASAASGKPTGCVCHDNVPGNPAFFDSSLVPELMALTGDCGGKKVLHKHMENCFFYPLSDEKELEDVDTHDFFIKDCGK